MEKRLFLAFFITLLFFIVWSYLVPPPASRQTLFQQAQEKYPAPPESLPEFKPTSLEPSLIKEDEPGDLAQTTIDDFIVIYSPTGGYIKSIAIKTPDNELPFKNIGFLPSQKDIKFTTSIKEGKIEFKSSTGAKKEFVFEGYTLRMNFNPPASTPILIFSNYLHPSTIDQRYQEIFYFQEGLIQRISPQKIKEAVYDKVTFAGARDRYYCLSLLKGSYNIKWVRDKNRTHLLLLSPQPQILLYIGPQTSSSLKPFDLQGIIYYGFFHGLGMILIKFLNFFYFLTKNWGLSIICFAIFIYLILFPFTAKSTKAMKRMQQLQPEIEALKEKYKDAPQKLQKEIIELYRKYKVNPLGGCLPLFFQLPIFIALYQILFRFADLKEAQFLWIKDLSLPDRLFPLPVQLPFLGGYLNILPIGIVILGLIQQKISTSSTGSSQQKSMGLFFSILLGVIFYNFPAALVLYWFVQNLLTLTYQLRLIQSQSAQITLESH